MLAILLGCLILYFQTLEKLSDDLNDLVCARIVLSIIATDASPRLANGTDSRFYGTWSHM